MCILLLELASNSLWLCDSKTNFSTSDNDNVSSDVKNNNLRGQIIYPSSSNIILEPSPSSNNDTIKNSFYQIISEPLPSRNNDTIKNSFYQIISEPSPSSSNEKIINDYSEKKLEPSPSSSNEKILEPSSSNRNGQIINDYSEKILEPSSSRRIILNDNHQGNKEPSSSNISLTNKNINIKSLDNLYLHFIWILLPIIIIIIFYRKKKYNKFKKIGIDCIKYKNKTLKRCKSMPNIYQFLPVISQERGYVSDTEIEL